MTPFGISEKSYKTILASFDSYPQIEEVVVFGSRAKGNYKPGSDIDLAIKGKECTRLLAMELDVKLNEELPVPYHVDVMDYASLEHQELKEHIDRAGVVFYKKGK
jgi:uncharacterized protein